MTPMITARDMVHRHRWMHMTSKDCWQAEHTLVVCKPYSTLSTQHQ